VHHFRVEIPIPDPLDRASVFQQVLYIQSSEDNLTIEDVKNVCERLLVDEKKLNPKDDNYIWGDCLDAIRCAKDRIFIAYPTIQVSTITEVETYDIGDKCVDTGSIVLQRIEFEQKERRHANRI